MRLEDKTSQLCHVLYIEDKEYECDSNCPFDIEWHSPLIRACGLEGFLFCGMIDA